MHPRSKPCVRHHRPVPPFPVVARPRVQRLVTCHALVWRHPHFGPDHAAPADHRLNRAVFALDRAHWCACLRPCVKGVGLRAVQCCEEEVGVGGGSCA
eukprot:3765699-Rhodomonas_salina.1